MIETGNTTRHLDSLRAELMRGISGRRRHRRTRAAIGLAAIGVLAGTAAAATLPTWLQHTDTHRTIAFQADATRVVTGTFPAAIRCVGSETRLTCSPIPGYKCTQRALPTVGQFGLVGLNCTGQIDSPKRGIRQYLLDGRVPAVHRLDSSEARKLIESRFPASTTIPLGPTSVRKADVLAAITKVHTDFWSSLPNLLALHLSVLTTTLSPPDGQSLIASCARARVSLSCQAVPLGAKVPVGAPIYQRLTDPSWITTAASASTSYRQRASDLEQQAFGRPLTRDEQIVLLALLMPRPI